MVDPVAVVARDEEVGRCRGISPERREKVGGTNGSPERRKKGDEAAAARGTAMAQQWLRFGERSGGIYMVSRVGEIFWI